MSKTDKPETLLVHGCAILLGNKGILIRGSSDSGKSRTARLMIERFKQNDIFACWIADDRVCLSIHSHAVLAQVPDSIAGLAERRFFGIDNVCYERIGRLDFVVDLLPMPEIDRMPDPQFVTLLDRAKPLPLIKAPQTHTALAVETICGYFPTN